MKIKHILMFSWIVIWREIGMLIGAAMVPFVLLLVILMNPEKTILQPALFMIKLKKIAEVFPKVRADYNQKAAAWLKKRYAN